MPVKNRREKRGGQLRLQVLQEWRMKEPLNLANHRGRLRRQRLEKALFGGEVGVLIAGVMGCGNLLQLAQCFQKQILEISVLWIVKRRSQIQRTDISSICFWKH